MIIGRVLGAESSIHLGVQFEELGRIFLIVGVAFEHEPISLGNLVLDLTTVLEIGEMTVQLVQLLCDLLIDFLLPVFDLLRRRIVLCHSVPDLRLLRSIDGQLGRLGRSACFCVKKRKMKLEIILKLK